MVESASGSEIDEIRGDLARCRHEISPYELDNNDVTKQLCKLKSRSGP